MVGTRIEIGPLMERARERQRTWYRNPKSREKKKAANKKWYETIKRNQRNLQSQISILQKTIQTQENALDEERAYSVSLSVLIIIIIF